MITKPATIINTANAKKVFEFIDVSPEPDKASRSQQETCPRFALLAKLGRQGHRPSRPAGRTRTSDRLANKMSAIRRVWASRFRNLKPEIGARIPHAASPL